MAPIKPVCLNVRCSVMYFSMAPALCRDHVGGTWNFFGSKVMHIHVDKLFLGVGIICEKHEGRMLENATNSKSICEVSVHSFKKNVFWGRQRLVWIVVPWYPLVPSLCAPWSKQIARSCFSKLFLESCSWGLPVHWNNNYSREHILFCTLDRQVLHSRGSYLFSSFFVWQVVCQLWKFVTSLHLHDAHTSLGKLWFFPTHGVHWDKPSIT